MIITTENRRTSALPPQYQTVEFLNAWSSTMTSLNGNADRFLAAGIYGYQWANVAEIMRTYSGWAPADVTKFQNWLLDEYYPLNHQFLTGHNGAAITNYWANWDLCNMAAAALGSICSPRLRRGVELRRTTPTGMVTGPSAEPGAARDVRGTEERSRPRQLMNESIRCLEPTAS